MIVKILDKIRYFSNNTPIDNAYLISTVYRFTPTVRLANVTLASYLFLMLIVCRSSMINLSIIGALTSQLIALVATLAIFTLVILYNFRSRSFWCDVMHRLAALAIISIPLLIVMILKWEHSLIYLTIIIILAEIAVLSLVAKFNTIAKIFIYMIAFIASFSLVANYIFRDIIFSNNWPEFLEIINPIGNRYKNVIFTYILDLPYYFRNYAIFREPGVFVYFSTMAAVLVVCIRRLFNLTRQIALLTLFLAALLTTFSPTGFACIVCLLILVVSQINQFRVNLSFRTRIIIIAITAISLIGVVGLINSNQDIRYSFGETISKPFSNNESSNARLASFELTTGQFVSSPLWGVDSTAVLQDNGDNTFSPGIILAVFGLIGGIAIIYSGMLFTAHISRRIGLRRALPAICALLLAISTQNLVTEYFFYLFPFILIFSSAEKYINQPIKRLFKGIYSIVRI